MSEKPSKRVLFMGNSLLDISAKCDQKLLDEYHLKVDDNCEAEDWQLPIFDKLLAMPDAITTPGGSAQNSARITQQLLTPITGAQSVYFVGSIGNDKTGQVLQELVQLAKVHTLYYRHPTLNTGVSAGMVTSDTNRTLMANIGASKAMPIDFLDTSAVRSALNDSIVYFVESYFMTHSPTTVHSLAKISQKLNKYFFISLSATYVVSQHFQQLMQLMPLSDAVFANAAEALTFYTHLTGQQTQDMQLIAKSIVKIEKSKQTDNSLWTGIKRCVFITQGSGPVIVAKCLSDDKVIVNEYFVPKLVIKGDTIGAGDAFAGGVVAHLVCGHSIEESVDYGIGVSAQVCQNRGCVLN